MRNILIPLIVVFLALGGYFIYQIYLDEQEVDIWDTVPNSTVLVLETNEIEGILNKLDSTSIANSLVKSYSEKNTSSLYKQFIQNKTTTLVSLHITSSSSIDLLFSINVKGVKNEIEKTIQEFAVGKNLKSTTRIFKNIEIIDYASDQESFSYSIAGDFLIASQTAYLVEDAIRTYSEENIKSLKEENSQLFTLSELKTDDGNLYLNGTKLNDLFSTFLQTELNLDLIQSGFYDLRINEAQIALNGFIYSENNQIFGNQEPTKINLLEWIPNTAQYLYHKGVSGEKIATNNIDVDSLDVERLSKWLGSEIALIDNTTSKSSDYKKILFVQTKDINEALNHINTLSEGRLALGDTVYNEIYSDHQIKELPIVEFPRYVFGDEFEGFDQCFYFVMDSYLILGNSIQSLKDLLNHIEDESTWGRSVEYGPFLNSTLSEANMSLYFNFYRLWGTLFQQLDIKWQQLFSEANWQHSIGKGAVQFSIVGDKYYSSIVLELNNAPQLKGKFDIERESYFISGLTTKPYVVKNHNDQSFETFIQDSSTNVYLIGSEGDVLWKDSIGDQIVTAVHQIDFYRNRKLQYLFGTKDALHLIDRNGSYVEGFPRNLGININKLSVLDYDNSKRYRFSIEDGQGNVYLYDKMLRNLDGWNPRKVDGQLLVPLRHVRVRGKDYMIAIEKNGEINLMNRRGEYLAGFPKKLNVTLNGEAFIKLGSNTSNSLITVVSKEGEIISINFNGQITNSRELYKPSINTEFSMALAHNDRSYIIYRYDQFRLAILNDSGQILFEKDYLDADIEGVQYYDLGLDDEIYIVHDRNQNFAYIYDSRGELINYTPLSSSYEIGLMDYSSSLNKTMLYVAYKDRLTVYSY